MSATDLSPNPWADPCSGLTPRYIQLRDVDRASIGLRGVRIEDATPEDRAIVYFLQPEGGGPIKIGTTSAVRLAARVAGVQTGHPEPLIVRRRIRGGREVESALHDEFSAYRMSGEWFTAMPELAGLARAIPASDGEQRYVRQVQEAAWQAGWVKGCEEGQAIVGNKAGRHLANALFIAPDMRRACLEEFAAVCPHELRRALGSAE